MGGTNFGGMVSSMGVPLLGQNAPLGGSHWFVRPASGSDGHGGKSVDNALDTLTKALALAASGNNDVIHIIGDGGTTGSVREDAAITISESSLAIIGEGAPSLYSQRSRIAPNTTADAVANYITVSGSGNLFANLQVFHGFATGTTSQIALTISGSRNVFKNCHIAGMGDTESGADAGSRCVKITGQENLFEDCVIGVDTVTRSAANASVEFASGATRNVFRRCIFPFFGDDAAVLGVKVAAASGMDRFNIFEQCLFLNAVGSTSTTMSALATLAASAGGYLLFKDCLRLGITDWGTDATSNAQIFTLGAAGVAATAGFVGDDIGRAAVATAS